MSVHCHSGWLVDRATRAYFHLFPQGAQPSRLDSDIGAHDGRTLFVVRNVNGLLRVYELRPGGMLKGLTC
jgi:hypothetical protein